MSADSGDWLGLFHDRVHADPPGARAAKTVRVRRPGKRYRCLDCGDVVQSRHRRDFVRCACDRIYVDGGSECPRVGFEGREPEVVA